MVEARYVKLATLGTGSFGTVYKVRRTSDNLIFALKEFHDCDMVMIMQEIKAL